MDGTSVFLIIVLILWFISVTVKMSTIAPIQIVSRLDYIFPNKDTIECDIMAVIEPSNGHWVAYVFIPFWVISEAVTTRLAAETETLVKKGAQLWTLKLKNVRDAQRPDAYPILEGTIAYTLKEKRICCHGLEPSSPDFTVLRVNVSLIKVTIFPVPIVPPVIPPPPKPPYVPPPTPAEVVTGGLRTKFKTLDAAIAWHESEEIVAWIAAHPSDAHIIDGAVELEKRHLMDGNGGEWHRSARRF